MTQNNVDQTDPGMTDVHSGSDQAGSDGQAVAYGVRPGDPFDVIFGP